MKNIIKVTDKKTGKVVEKEFNLRNIDHFNIQRNTRTVIFKDKKKYNRKEKHKGKEEY